MKNYKELEVWQKSIELARIVYTTTQAFPGHEIYGLTSQIRRTVISVAANRAEGWGRSSTREYIHFLSVARGSLMELETHMILSQELSYISSDQEKQYEKQIQSIAMMLNRLIKSLYKSIKSPGSGTRQ